VYVIFCSSIIFSLLNLNLTFDMTLHSFVYFSLPFALSTAVSIRIGHLLGSQRKDTASLSAKITVIAGVIITGFSGLLIYLLSGLVGYIFTSDSDIQYRVTQLAPILSIFLVAYGVQGCAQGILRGIGRQAELTM
jgi:MATE family multidrug resistance protein